MIAICTLSAIRADALNKIINHEKARVFLVGAPKLGYQFKELWRFSDEILHMEGHHNFKEWYENMKLTLGPDGKEKWV